MRRWWARPWASRARQVPWMPWRSGRDVVLEAHLTGVGNSPILGILDITWKSSHKKDHIPILVGWCSMGTFNDPCTISDFPSSAEKWHPSIVAGVININGISVFQSGLHLRHLKNHCVMTGHRADLYQPAFMVIINRLLTIINHYQLLLTIINHYQPWLTMI